MVLVLRDHYHSFMRVKKAFRGILKKTVQKGWQRFECLKEDVFKKTDKLSVLLKYASIILLYKLIFDQIRWLCVFTKYTTLKFITEPQSS